jgi:acyl-CoA synthetase (AMP-forming)/AMP-acid ligase II
MLVGDIIRLNALSRGSDEALITADRRLTYAELNREINRVASALSSAGVGVGDRVAVLGKNSLEYFCLYYGLAKLGAIIVPLNFWYRSAEHDYAIGDSDPKLLFVEDEFAEMIGALSASASASGERTVAIVPLPAPDGSGREGWDRFTEGATSTDEPDAAFDADSPHMILYTSGTTGKPKGALLSHRRTVEDALGMAAVLPVRGTDTFINYFPPFHVGNWDHMKLLHLVGARVILLRQFDAKQVIDLIPEERVTVVLGVPTMLHALLNHPDFDGTDTSSVRLVYYGAYDPSGIMDRVADVFGAREGRCEMAHTYGLTEAGPFVTVCEPQDIFARWGSIGRAIPGVEVALLDENGRPAGPEEAGEICIKGPRMTGYWNKPEATAAALEGGWLHTGDIAVADKDGFLRIVDRKKDMIRTGGQNVYSKEVEDTLLGHEAVADVGVIGLPDPVYEERVCAIVVLRPGFSAGEEMADHLQRHVRTLMAGYNAPREVHFLDELPKNAVGKTQKHLLREQFGSMFDQQAHGGG